MAKPIPIGGKQTILDHWDSLDPDQPLAITPIDSKHKGTTYTEDTIRLTGSKEFIDSVLAHIKGMLEYNGNGCRLEPIYMQTVTRVMNDEGKLVPGELTGSYAFYCKVKSRGNGQGRPRGRKNGTTTERPVKPEATPNPLREVNAGLKLKAKPKAEESPASEQTKKKDKLVQDAPVYAIASSFLDEDGNIDPVWSDPEDNEYGTTTYDDFLGCDDAIQKLKKDKRWTKQNLEIIQIEVDKKGKPVYTQV
jgi:hypothetical protein